MTESEQAKKYADGKVYEALTAVVEKAFADGYDAGYKEALTKMKTEVVEEDGITYVDLGLPSGTLWASDYLRDADGNLLLLSYDEAAPLNIPTKEMYEELNNHCNVSINVTAKRDLKYEKIYDFVSDKKKISLSDEPFWIRKASNSTSNHRGVVSTLKVMERLKTVKCRVILVKEKSK